MNNLDFFHKISESDSQMVLQSTNNEVSANSLKQNEGLSSIFNINIIKEIIFNYFNCERISNYIYYSDSFYITLSKILNEMLECPHYDNSCHIFFENYKMIDINRLLEHYDIFLECQILLPFLYEILLIMQTVDSYNITINDKLLFELLEDDQRFGFMLNTVLEIKNKMDIDDIIYNFNPLLI